MQKKKILKLSKILKEISLYFDIPEKSIRSKLRQRDVVISRYIFAKIAREQIINRQYYYTLTDIGDYIGVDHSTAHYYIENYRYYDLAVYHGNNIKKLLENV